MQRFVYHFIFNSVGTPSPWHAPCARCPTSSSRSCSGLATSTPRWIPWSTRTSTGTSGRRSATRCSACSATGGRTATCPLTSISDAPAYATTSGLRVSTRKAIWTRRPPRTAASRRWLTIYNTGTRRCWRRLPSSSSVWQPGGTPRPDWGSPGAPRQAAPEVGQRQQRRQQPARAINRISMATMCRRYKSKYPWSISTNGTRTTTPPPRRPRVMCKMDEGAGCGEPGAGRGINLMQLKCSINL